MIDPGSLIGFALAFVLLSWVLSALALAVMRLLRDRLRAAGAQVERTAAALALALPAALALTVTVALAVRSLGAGHHCLVHGTHPHLCLLHGELWGAQPWAVGALAALAGALAVALLRRVLHGLRARVALRHLAGAATRVDIAGIATHLVPSARAHSFVAGLLHARIFMTTAAWQALDEAGRHAVVAHERAHVTGRHLLWRWLLGALALLGAPVLSASLLRRWSEATERLCDAQAAEAVGDATVVAAALVQVARGVGAGEPALGLSFPSHAAELEARVHAVLGGAPDGRRAASWLRAAATALLVVTLSLCVVAAEPIHHALETLLGAL